jgi:hypothetical protein
MFLRQRTSFLYRPLCCSKRCPVHVRARLCLHDLVVGRLRDGHQHATDSSARSRTINATQFLHATWERRWAPCNVCIGGHSVSRRIALCGAEQRWRPADVGRARGQLCHLAIVHRRRGARGEDVSRAAGLLLDSRAAKLVELTVVAVCVAPHAPPPLRCGNPLRPAETPPVRRSKAAPGRNAVLVAMCAPPVSCGSRSSDDPDDRAAGSTSTTTPHALEERLGSSADTGRSCMRSALSTLVSSSLLVLAALSCRRCSSSTSSVRDGAAVCRSQWRLAAFVTLLGR